MINIWSVVVTMDSGKITLSRTEELGEVLLCLEGTPYLDIWKWISGALFGLLYGGNVNSVIED